MKKVFPLVLLLILGACQQDCTEECEKKCKELAMSWEPLPVDLPEPSETHLITSDANVLEVAVNSDNRYVLDNKEYDYVDLVPEIDAWLATVDSSLATLKIAGDKSASYEHVFNLIVLAKERNLKPVLAFED